VIDFKDFIYINYLQGVLKILVIENIVNKCSVLYGVWILICSKKVNNKLKQTQKKKKKYIYIYIYIKKKKNYFI